MRISKITWISVGIVAIVAIVATTSKHEECTGREERDRWIDTPSTEYRGSSPRQVGLRPLGTCHDEISSVQLSCDFDKVRSIESDSPYLRRARELGFTTYVCERIGSGERTEYPIERILR